MATKTKKDMIMQTFSNIPLQIPTDKVDLIVSIIKDIGKNMKIQVKELSASDDKNTILKQKNTRV